MREKDKESVIKCPDCGGYLTILDEWVNIHDKEALWHCWDCDAIYQVFYKLERIVRLKPEPVEVDSFLSEIEEAEKK